MCGILHVYGVKFYYYYFQRVFNKYVVEYVDR